MSARAAAAPARARVRLPGVPIAIATAVVALAVLLAVLGPVLAPTDPNAQDLLIGVSGPAAGHPLGTDDLGRDVFSRLLVGGRTAVVGPAVIALGALLIGSALGMVAGYRGGWAGTAFMRVADLVYAVPGLLVAIVVAGVVGGGYWLAVGLLTVLFCVYDLRIVRAAVLEQR